MAGVVSTLSVDQQTIEAALDDALMATDLADYLVNKDIPFRQAYAAVGKASARPAS